MVMRHGAGVDGSGGGGGGGPARLGCYFCNDVVAPQNSMKDRTIDQQCTVTRPGLAPIASALLVELLVSILHHPLRHRAPAPAPRAAQAAGAEPQCLLGELPHQIRGSLPRFEQMSIAGEAFPQCTACSGKVVDAFAAAGFNGFLLRAFNEPSFLEDLTGLTELRSSAAIDDLLMGELGFDSDDDQDAATPREGSDADDF
jgi:ubiquitin-like modifier-activating enzyme ATG7